MMEKASRKSRNTSKHSETNDKSSRKDDLSKDGSNKGSDKEGVTDETSDEDEVVNYPNQPPIQNGFVVFIHQLNLATTTKEKRTVVEWISDALKMLDITPETITVDKMMEQSISTCTKPKVPIIKFSRPPGKRHNDDQEPNAPSFRFRTKNRKTSDNEHGGTKDESDTGSPSRAHMSKTKPSKKNQASKSVKNDKSKTGPISSGGNGQISNNQSWKGTNKLTPQKSVNSTSSKGLQRKSGRPVKPQIIEDKKQEFGVQFYILRDKCRTMQRENNKCVWVLLIESRRRCIVDMGKLNSLASKFRFKVRWIPAQAPRSLDQSVFTVVNDIVQTKNICFPEQMIVDMVVQDKEAKPLEGKRRQGKLMAKPPHVEILHKTLSAQFDVSSYASFEINEFVDFSSPSSPPNQNTKTIPPTTEETFGEEENDTVREKPRQGPDTNDEDNTNLNSKTLNSTDSSKTTFVQQNTTVQLALVAAANPFPVINFPSQKTDVLGLNGCWLPTDFDSDEAKCGTSEDNDRTDNYSVREAKHNSVVVIIHYKNKEDHHMLSTVLANTLCQEGIPSETIALSNLLTEYKVNQVEKNFANNICGSQEVEIDYTVVIQKALDNRLVEEDFKVIIVDVEDEAVVKMWSVYEYAVQIGFKTVTIEIQSGEIFENSLKTILNSIRQRHEQHSRLAGRVPWDHITKLSLSKDHVLKPRVNAGMRSSILVNYSGSSKSVVKGKSDRRKVSSSNFKYSVGVDRRKSDNPVYKWALKSKVHRCESTAPVKATVSWMAWMNIFGLDAMKNKKSKSKIRSSSYTTLNMGSKTSTHSLKASDTPEDAVTPIANENENGNTLKTCNLKLIQNVDVFDFNSAEVEDSEFFPSSFYVDHHFSSNEEESSSEASYETDTYTETADESVDSEDPPTELAAKPSEAFGEESASGTSLRLKLQKVKVSSNFDLLKDTNSNISPTEELQNIAPVENSSSISRKDLKYLFEIHRNRKKENKADVVSSASEEEEQNCRVSKELETRKMKKGFFHKTHMRLAGFFHRICSCGRKIRQSPKIPTKPSKSVAKDSLTRKCTHRFKSRKRYSHSRNSQ